MRTRRGCRPASRSGVRLSRAAGAAQEGNRREPSLRKELAALQEEVASLRALAAMRLAEREKLERLANFPEENPNPVIEMNLAGQTTYLNPAAQAMFSDLWSLGCQHPLMQGLRFPFVARPGEKPSHIVREIQIADSVYEQKVSYMGRADRDHIRIYVHDITRRKRAEETNQLLLRRLMHAHEEERQRISRELHDEAGQALTALKLSLELIRGETPHEVKMVRKHLAEAIRLTEATKEQIRILARGLRPPALDAVGLNLTLESFCRDFSRRTRLLIGYEGTEIAALPDMADICLYRTLQEALANVVRHAGATRVKVRLENDADQVRLVVEDNGAGPGARADGTSAKDSGGIGLLGVQERLHLFGGNLKIEKGDKGGVRLEASLPLRDKK